MTKGTEIETTTNEVELKRKVRKLRQENQQLKKKNDVFVQREKELRDTVKRVTDENKKLRRIKYEYEHIDVYSQIEKAKSTLENKLMKLEEELDAARNELYALQESSSVEALLELSEFRDRLVSENRKLKQDVQRKDAQNQKLQNKLINYRELDKQRGSTGTIESLQKGLSNVKEERDILQEKYNDLLSGPSVLKADSVARASVERLIEELQHRLNPGNLAGFANLYVLYQRYEKLFNRNKEKIRNVTSAKASAKPVIEFGYVFQEGGWTFRTMEDISYPVVDTLLNIQNGTPVKAIIRSGYAHVIKRYKFQNNKASSREKRKLRRVKIHKRIQYPYFGEFTVLVIGIENKKRYTSRLRAHGLKVLWYDPLDERYKELGRLVNKADVVVVCKRHIRHGVEWYLDEEDPKIEWLTHDNADNLANAVKLAAMRLLLMD